MTVEVVANGKTLEDLVGAPFTWQPGLGVRPLGSTFDEHTADQLDSREYLEYIDRPDETR